ncbi:phosphoserine transaminase [Cupriavidus sp. USMAA2-4]|uniref:Phosphoserine aminotransferase n=1 Tax=Cupriavidus malaysiensis TaxID=367825 RepID=A0ABM6F259_9BURK|nr:MULTISPECIES: 3-phosphoserine/phosphohydroxythreonine transaminase [Cupriavidus]AOY91390.1 phosphoserine transaminase [Cupriavidus sp. USMAA2-4]AOY99041.1 phosphoserine transaminase [Cupriavidus sp. USMAHM13]AOZ05463.1 phosphoserine transaminase [Cupriavidus malaysiensis]
MNDPQNPALAAMMQRAVAERVYNFSPGPAALPAEVLQQAAEEMLSWHGSGVSVMEMSHRSREFESILAQAEADLRELLQVPKDYRILFLQGGAIGENAIVPLNLMRRLDAERPKADFVVTGTWSVKTEQEARRYGEVNIAASSVEQKFVRIPDVADWKLADDSAYLHLCTNETIVGVEFQEVPEVGQKHGRVVVADVSSHILSRPVDWSRLQVVYGGAQKNIGPAGVTIVIVREDLLGHAHPLCPSAFNWRLAAEHGSMYNTPPTYAIYIAGLVFQWLKRQGGVPAVEQRNIAKAKALYDFLDQSAFYRNEIDPSCRSRMNVPFFLADESRNEAFLAQARAAGLVQLKGHKSVGGMRASIYNAMPLEGVMALIDFMREFERSAA